MIGLPPSARFPAHPAVPADPVEHAKDFCARYDELLEAIARKRMREVGVPEDRIGMIDPDFNYRLAAFHPYGRSGAACTSRPAVSTWMRVYSCPICLPKVSAEGIVPPCEKSRLGQAGRHHRP